MADRLSGETAQKLTMPGWLRAALETARKTCKEVGRQFDLWGQQDHPDVARMSDGLASDFYYEAESYLEGIRQHLDDILSKNGKIGWDLILLEEVFEALVETGKVNSEEALKEELIQVAAVAWSWIAAIERREQ